MVVQCAIEFDNNPNGIYFAGQILTGKITLTADRSKQVKGVVLAITGIAHTQWSESTGTQEERKHRHYSGDETYINSQTFLLGSNYSADNLCIEPGIHVFNFSCHIPNNCPSSFESFYGHVRYLVRVTLIRPWKFDAHYTNPFTVLKVMDLNYAGPLLNLPAHFEMQKVFCCGPCKSAPLQLQLSLPQSGYVPGQHIPVTVLVQNESSIEVQTIKIELVMVAHFSADNSISTKSVRTVITKFKSDERVLRQSNKRIECQLPVPATPPTCFNSCRIIQITYLIEVEAKIKNFMHTNQVICAPVTIGNVPLHTVIQQQPNARSLQAANADSGLIIDANRLSHFSADANQNAMQPVQVYAVAEAKSEKLPSVGEIEGNAQGAPNTPWDDSVQPPSFEVASHMATAKLTEGVQHEYGSSEYAPLYPVFNIASPLSPAPEDTDDVFVIPGNAVDKKSTWL